VVTLILFTTTVIIVMMFVATTTVVMLLVIIVMMLVATTAVVMLLVIINGVEESAQAFLESESIGFDIGVNGLIGVGHVEGQVTGVSQKYFKLHTVLFYDNLKGGFCGHINTPYYVLLVNSQRSSEVLQEAGGELQTDALRRRIQQ
jgi:hypothetical protein